ncbi:hypothetical protein ONE63_001966 [Megalurothrips usitatus]|uniref:Uncharacterized protein n=1 Tax=Megalurothrips usitatus TaxID=439358 RepID=A0AAV7X9Z8_9NEOP|nr:hypothetical protein ONE63_001966 [Megalurothrips usitatus]
MSADEDDDDVDPTCREDVRELRRLLAAANESALRAGASVEDLYRVFLQSRPRRRARRETAQDGGGVSATGVAVIAGLVLAAVAALLGGALGGADLLGSALGVRCVLPNNFLVWEATRPIADCGICRGVDAVLELHNVSRAAFAGHAYSSRPILVKGAAAGWPAMHTFSYDFFKRIYEATEGAYESVEDECQLLTFKTEFLSLKDVFSMSRSRVLNLDGELPWYIGWSNCHPSILAEMRSEYSRPSFLPPDAEHAHHDFIFMGYSQGASMHLDYISRLMWQAQLKGHKTWMLTPPPECEHVCSSFSFRAEPGDIVLLDTRQWYHRTQIDGKEFSLTVSSEYG